MTMTSWKNASPYLFRIEPLDADSHLGKIEDPGETISVKPVGSYALK
jgi:hypothetical protein